MFLNSQWWRNDTYPFFGRCLASFYWDWMKSAVSWVLLFKLTKWFIKIKEPISKCEFGSMKTISQELQREFVLVHEETGRCNAADLRPVSVLFHTCLHACSLERASVLKCRVLNVDACVHFMENRIFLAFPK